MLGDISGVNEIYIVCGYTDMRKSIDGFVLLYKRLAVEGRYRWPRDKSEVKPLTWQQFDWLMSGLEIEQPKAIGTYKNVDNLLPKNGDCEQFTKTSQSLENTAFLAVNEA